MKWSMNNNSVTDLDLRDGGTDFKNSYKNFKSVSKKDEASWQNLTRKHTTNPIFLKLKFSAHIPNISALHDAQFGY